MSTYYYGKVFVRTKETKEEPAGEWNLVDTGCFNVFKNLLCGWDSMVDTNYSPWEPDLYEKASTYYTYEYLGLFEKDTILKNFNVGDLSTFAKDHTTKNDKMRACVLTDTNSEPIIYNVKPNFEFDEVQVLSEGEYNRLKEAGSLPLKYLLMSDLINMPDSECEKYISLFYKEVRHYDGKFYTAKDFNLTKKEVTENLYKEIGRKNYWENLQKSVDYLKLSADDKENVMSEFQDMDEAIEDYENQLYACDYFISLLNFFDDDRDYHDEHWHDRESTIFLYSQ